MSRAVVERTATVYKGGGRTYITKAGAYKRAAVMLIHAKPGESHEEPDFDEYGRQMTPSCTCSRCMFGSDSQKKLIKRLARWLKWRDNKLVSP